MVGSSTGVTNLYWGLVDGGGGGGRLIVIGFGVAGRGAGGGLGGSRGAIGAGGFSFPLFQVGTSTPSNLTFFFRWSIAA